MTFDPSNPTRLQRALFDVVLDREPPRLRFCVSPSGLGYEWQVYLPASESVSVRTEAPGVVAGSESLHLPKTVIVSGWEPDEDGAILEAEAALEECELETEDEEGEQ